MTTYGACYFCKEKGENYSARIFLCERHANLWRKYYHRVFAEQLSKSPIYIENEDWNRESWIFASKLERVKVEFT